LFLEEEREKELEQMYNNDMPDSKPAGEDDDEAEAVSKSTSESMMAGEKIMEAIELADTEREALKTWEDEVERLGPEKGSALPRPVRSAELQARGDMSGEEFVWKTIRGVPAAGMEDALLVLPFRQVISLLVYLDQWARKVSDSRRMCGDGKEHAHGRTAISSSLRVSCRFCSERTLLSLLRTARCALSCSTCAVTCVKRSMARGKCLGTT